MDIGIGFTETLLVLGLILVFFGSSRLPQMLRQIGRVTAQIRAKINEAISEVQETANKMDSPDEPDPSEEKNVIRKDMRVKRKALSEEERDVRSGRICGRLMETELWKSSKAVMLYSALPDEVQTSELIQTALREGKRVSIPYFEKDDTEMSISEITEYPGSLQPGRYGILEPLPEQIRAFYRSDLDLVVCPGLAFDRNGGRIGFGKGCYDDFLRETRGRVPAVALAFAFQMIDESIPFSYGDIPMRTIFTEEEVIATNAG